MAVPSIDAVAQQIKRSNADRRGESFNTAQTEVALAALQSADIGAVEPELVSERLLRQVMRKAVAAEVGADGTSKVAVGHGSTVVGRYLRVYRLISSIEPARGAAAAVMEVRNEW